MTMSFRARLFLTAVLIVSAVLAVVLLLGWSSVLAFELERLDDRLCMEARRIVTQPLRSDDISRLQADVMSKLHLRTPDQVMLRYESSSGGDNFQTTNWQTAFESDTLQWQQAKSNHSFVQDIQTRDQRPNPPRSQLSQESQESQESQSELRTVPPPKPRPASRLEPRPEPRPEPTQPPPPPESQPQPQPISTGYCSLAQVDRKIGLQGHQWHVARLYSDRGFSLIAADSSNTEAEFKRAFSQALKLIIPLALILAALGAWLLSALVMRPISRLRIAMKNVTQNALDQRLSSVNEDREFKTLIDAYNTMLSRLEASFQQTSRFSSDAAHELKTPLTILQGRIELLRHKSDQPAMQAELTELLDEVSRLSAITRKLLLLSQADAGCLAIQRVRIDLSRLLEESAVDIQMLITDQILKCEIEQNLYFSGDAVLLQQLFNNLVSNAVRYCRPGGLIELSAQARTKSIVVQLSNTTRALSLEDRARFFDRFYRGDAAHNRRIDGNGLGLSLAREIATAHGGELTLVESENTIVVLRLTLPLA